MRKRDRSRKEIQNLKTKEWRVFSPQVEREKERHIKRESRGPEGPLVWPATVIVTTPRSVFVAFFSLADTLSFEPVCVPAFKRVWLFACMRVCL